MRFFKSIFLCLTIWVLTALINTLLSGTMLLFFSFDFHLSYSVFFLVFLFTLIFSIPAMFIFWNVLMIYWNNKNLFLILLRVGFITSCLSVPLVIELMDEPISTEIWLSIFVIISAIGSIMFHHSIIRQHTNKNLEKENY